MFRLSVVLLPLMLIITCVSQAAEEAPTVDMHTLGCLDGSVQFVKQCIKVCKPVSINGHPYTLYHCTTQTNNSQKEEFTAVRLDLFSYPSLPFTREIKEEDFEKAFEIDNVIHKEKEEYALIKKRLIFLSARRVISKGFNSSEHYKAQFLGNVKMKKNNDAHAAFTLMQLLYASQTK